MKALHRFLTQVCFFHSVAVAVLGVCLPVSLFAAFNVHNWPPADGRPVPIIVDTDMADYDDPGALAVLHAFADAGKVRFLAVGVHAAQYNACTVDAFNTWYKRPNIPIGMSKTFGQGNPDWWASEPCLKCANDTKNALSSIPDVLTVYRRVLAAQPDTSVVFISIGPKTVLANFAQTPADSLSSLTGLQLISRKVKLVVDMGGDYPSGHEYNYWMDGPAAASYMTSWTVPKVFIGYSYGGGGIGDVMTDIGDNNPIRVIYKGTQHPAWDVSAALFVGVGLRFWTAVDNGHNVVDNAGNNTWSSQSLPGQYQAYLLYRKSGSFVQDSIAGTMDSLMLLPPRGDPPTAMQQPLPVASKLASAVEISYLQNKTITIHVPCMGPYEMRIVRADGKAVKTIHDNRVTSYKFSKQDFKSGVYFVNIISGTNRILVPMVVH